MKYICNGFSPKMLRHKGKSHLVKFTNITRREFMQNKKDCVSAVGHHVIAEELGIPRNRFNICLDGGDTLYIVQNGDGRSHGMDTPFSKDLTFQRVDVYY